MRIIFTWSVITLKCILERRLIRLLRLNVSKKNTQMVVLKLPQLELQCKHDKTKTQFNFGSLVTFANVCYDINDNNNCIYPGQVGMILNKGKKEFYENDYVQVLLLVIGLATWNSYSKYDESKLIDLFSNRAKLIININKYNLIPIFQTQLKLENKSQLEFLQKFNVVYANLTNEEFK